MRRSHRLGLLAQLLIPASALAADTPNTSPSRILPQQSRDSFWDRTSVGLDITYTDLGARTRESLETQGIGLGLLFEQHIRSAFWGLVRVGFDSWRTTSGFASGAGSSLFPIRLTSEIIAEAPLWLLPGHELFSFFRPYATGGLGYMTFSSAEADSVNLLKALRGESIGFLGVGLRISLGESVAVKCSWESWKGLETSRFSGEMWVLGAQFGDHSRK